MFQFLYYYLNWDHEHYCGKVALSINFGYVNLGVTQLSPTCVRLQGTTKARSPYSILQFWRKLGLELAFGATAVVPLDKDLAGNRRLLRPHLATRTGQSRGGRKENIHRAGEGAPHQDRCPLSFHSLSASIKFQPGQPFLPFTPLLTFASAQIPAGLPLQTATQGCSLGSEVSPTVFHRICPLFIRSTCMGPTPWFHT